MVLHIVAITAITTERKVNTVIAPFDSISSIDFEYEIDGMGKETGELLIHYNSSCADTVINEKDVESLRFRIYEDEDGNNMFEATTIKGFEKDFIQMMTRYMRLVHGELIDDSKIFT